MRTWQERPRALAAVVAAVLTVVTAPFLVGSATAGSDTPRAASTPDRGELVRVRRQLATVGVELRGVQVAQREALSRALRWKARALRAEDNRERRRDRRRSRR
jgi:hypothetical protein